MGQFTAFLDASVLYPAPLRDLLLELAVADLYRVKWSDLVHKEWIKSLLRSRHNLTRAQLERTRGLMNAHARDALVTDFEQLIDILDLPDPADRHVLAAAIKGRADLIVTVNLKDFPADKLGRWGIEAQHPDEFLTHQFYLSQPAFLQAVKTVRLRLRNPPKSVEDYLSIRSASRASWQRSGRSNRSFSSSDDGSRGSGCIRRCAGSANLHHRRTHVAAGEHSSIKLMRRAFGFFSKLSNPPVRIDARPDGHSR